MPILIGLNIKQMNIAWNEDIRQHHLVDLWRAAIVLIVLLLLIALMIWALVSFGSYLYSLITSLF